MNTLQKIIKQELEAEGYLIPNDKYIEAIEEQLDRVNENQEHLYDVEDWIYETYHNDHTMLRKKNDNWEYAIDYLLKQRKLCIEQTGCKPSMMDYNEACQCEEYKDLVWGNIALDDIFEFLLDYYEKEGKVW